METAGFSETSVTNYAAALGHSADDRILNVVALRVPVFRKMPCNAKGHRSNIFFSTGSVLTRELSFWVILSMVDPVVARIPVTTCVTT